MAATTSNHIIMKYMKQIFMCDVSQCVTFMIHNFRTILREYQNTRLFLMIGFLLYRKLYFPNWLITGMIEQKLRLEERIQLIQFKKRKKIPPASASQPSHLPQSLREYFRHDDGRPSPRDPDINHFIKYLQKLTNTQPRLMTTNKTLEGL